MLFFFYFIPPKIFVVWVEFTWHLNIWRMPQHSWLPLLLVAWVENHYQMTLIEIIINYWWQMCCDCLNSVRNRGEVWMLLSNTGMQWWKRLSNCKVLSIWTISFFNFLFFQASVCLNQYMLMLKEQWCVGSFQHVNMLCLLNISAFSLITKPPLSIFYNLWIFSNAFMGLWLFYQ